MKRRLCPFHLRAVNKLQSVTQLLRHYQCVDLAGYRLCINCYLPSQLGALPAMAARCKPPAFYCAAALLERAESA